MEEKFEKVMNEDCVKEFLKVLACNEKYRNIIIPTNIKSNYCIGDNYVFFLFVDSLIKYIIIVDDMSYLNNYVDDVSLIFKKMNNYNDINKGVNTLLAKYVSKLLRLSSVKNADSKEKILRYIYKKYVVEGYFYYGYNSSDLVNIKENGLRKDGFILDSRLDEINDVLSKLVGRDIFYKLNISITDNFVVALYHSFIAPKYLEDLAKFVDGNQYYPFYVHDVDGIKGKFTSTLVKKKIPSNRINLVVDNFISKFMDDQIVDSHGCIAFIKREKVSKNYLKDIQEVFDEVKDLKLYNAIGMILESRYMSFDITDDILYSDLINVSVPDFKLLTNNNSINKKVSDDFRKIELSSDNPSENEDDSQNMSLVNSYGYVNVFMFFGLIFISIGVILSIVFYGG